jgi:thiol-disulfide isomerase/thioredoxin
MRSLKLTTTRRSFLAALPLLCTHAGSQAQSLGPGVLPMPAPAWALPVWTSRGSAAQSLSSQALLGQWVYLDFWASWCGPCRQSFPWMGQLQHQLRDQAFQVVAVGLDKQAPPMERFLSQFPGHVPVVWDPAAETAKRFEVQAMPSSYLIDPAGRVVWRHRGFQPSDGAAMLQAIRSHMARA